MGNLRNRSLLTAALMLAMCTAVKTCGNVPYLKQTGPAPLRFSPALAGVVTFTLPDLLVEREAPTNDIETVTDQSSETKTNGLTAQPAPVPPPPAIAPAPTVAPPQTNSATGPSASDMLVVSPQMLTEFFKPGADGTNAVVPAVAPTVPVGFTPPSVTPSSRATYNSP